MKSQTELKALSSDCGVIVKAVSCEMADAGYSPATLSMYRWVWRRFLRFAGNAPFSSALVDQFLQSKEVIAGAGKGFGTGFCPPSWPLPCAPCVGMPIAIRCVGT
jgi:hypothetical protein